jgi:hypothetical protein
MGGSGSGRWRDRKRIPVEDCLVLNAGKLQRDKLVAGGLRASGALTWTNTATGEKLSSIGYEADTLGAAPWLRLHYTRTRTGDAFDYRVRLSTSPLPWGGVRWAFLCPDCSRACRKLYLPNGAGRFACRRCYGLTYTSTQEAHKYDGMFRRLAADIGRPSEWRAIKRNLESRYA